MTSTSSEPPLASAASTAASTSSRFVTSQRTAWPPISCAVPFAAGRFARQQAERRTQRLAAGVFWLPLGVLPAEVIANHTAEQPRLLVPYEGAQILIELPPVTGDGRDGQQLLSDEVDDDLAVPAVIELHKKEALPRPEGKPAIHDRHGFTRAQ